jgi:hypothetical protein
VARQNVEQRRYTPMKQIRFKSNFWSGQARP